MALIKIRVAGIVSIVFTEVYTNFIREENETKTLSLSYTNGSGQTLTAGQELYSVGTIGTLGYLSVKAKNNTTILGSGSFDIDVTSYATATQPDGATTFTYDASPIVINIDYRSVPDADDFILEVPNRAVKTFTLADFNDHFSDFDGDTLAEVKIQGDVTGYEFNAIPYVADTWIAMADIGLLTYTPTDTDTHYEKDNNWIAKDSSGYISQT